MGVIDFLLLSCLSFAITVQAQDCSRPAPGPNMYLKDEYIVQETFTDGSKAVFACSVGYVAAGGSPAITCTAGSWSTLRLRCEKKICGSAGEVENGHIDYTEGIDFGATITVSCNDGYRLVGRSQIRCGALGWEGRLPICEVVSCDPPPSVVSATFSPDKDDYSYGEVVHYSCKNGSTLHGSVSISCSNDGTFKPAPPTCISVQCLDHEIENADWIGGSHPPYGHKASVTYQCRHGYKMIGSPTSICEMNSQWSPKLPTCEQIPATAKPTTTTTTTHLSTGHSGHAVTIVIVIVIAVAVQKSEAAKTEEELKRFAGGSEQTQAGNGQDAATTQDQTQFPGGPEQTQAGDGQDPASTPDQTQYEQE